MPTHDTSVRPARPAISLGSIWLGTALAVLAGVLLVIAGETMLLAETVESEFPSGRALREAGLVEKGWVPHWIPDDAEAVREVHNIDNNRSGLAFRVAGRRPWRPPPECLHGARHGFAGPRFDRDWLSTSEGRFDLFICPEGPLRGTQGRFRAVAVERGGDRVVSWTFAASEQD